MVPGSWGITAGPHVEWLSVAVTENYASPEALANGPATNDTVTGSAVSIPTRACRPVYRGGETGDNNTQERNVSDDYHRDRGQPGTDAPRVPRHPRRSMAG